MCVHIFGVWVAHGIYTLVRVSVGGPEVQGGPQRPQGLLRTI